MTQNVACAWPYIAVLNPINYGAGEKESTAVLPSDAPCKADHLSSCTGEINKGCATSRQPLLALWRAGH